MGCDGPRRPRWNELLGVAAWEIGAAQPLDKQGIAGKKMGRGIETDPARGMAWGMENREGKVADDDLLAVANGSVHRRRGGQAEHGEIVDDLRPGKELGIRRMHEDGRAGGLLDYGVAADMVRVAVGADNRLDAESFPPAEGENLLLVAAGINDAALLGLLAAHNIAAHRHGAHDQLFDDHSRDSQQSQVVGLQGPPPQPQLDPALARGLARGMDAGAVLTGSSFSILARNSAKAWVAGLVAVEER